MLCNNFIKKTGDSMGSKEKRTIKEVNGYKVNHPYSLGNLFFAVLSLGLIALPIALFFIPIVTFGSGPILSINGFDLFSFLIINRFAPTESAELVGEFLMSISYGDPTSIWYTVYAYVLIGQAAIVCLYMVVGVVAFIFFLINIIKGFLRHPRVIKGLTTLNFVFSIIFGLSYLFMLIMDKVMGGGINQLFIWNAMIPAASMLVILIFMSFTIRATYADVVYEKDLEFHEDEFKEDVSHVTEVHEVTKIKYESSKTLPQNLTSIGGHAYAENQALEIANIPLGIDKLGNGAFANCLSLKVVSLPESVREIGANCFFNCIELQRINYAGTKEQWRSVRRGSNWLAKAKTTEVVCNDGAVVVNPFH